jgi:hypothetical protein
MILDRDAIRTGLFGLVGFYNADNPDYPNLIPSLLTSRTGRRYNEAHMGLIDVENIDQSTKNYSHYVYPSYSGAVDTAGGYTAGSKVAFSGKNYEYINAAASVGGNPPPDPTYWREIDELSDYLIKVVYAGVDWMMDKWINEKKIRSKIKSIYDNVLLYNGIANYRNPVPNKDHFVGLRIRMKRGEKSLVTIINRLGFQFNAVFAGLTIRIYHSSQQDPISTFTIDQTQASNQQWVSIPTTEENKLRYISDDYEAGGDFYIGYKQSDLEALGAQALKMDLDWTQPPCDCDSKWRAWHRQWSQFVEVVGFEVEESAFGAGDTLFDPDKIGITFTNNYGLNLNLSNKCDIGYFVLQEEDLFSEALQYAVGLILLENMSTSTRGANQVANQIKKDAKRETMHFKGAFGTVFDKFGASIKGLSFDLSGLAEECFPCDDGNAEVIAGDFSLH